MSKRQPTRPEQKALVQKKAAEIARPVAPNKPLASKTKLKVIAALKRLHPMD